MRSIRGQGFLIRYSLIEASLCGYPLLVILDDLPMFCDHHKQILLYSLMDLSAQKTAKLTIVCLNTQPDCIQTFEKRIYSRYTQEISNENLDFHRSKFCVYHRLLRLFMNIHRRF